MGKIEITTFQDPGRRFLERDAQGRTRVVDEAGQPVEAVAHQTLPPRPAPPAQPTCWQVIKTILKEAW